MSNDYRELRIRAIVRRDNPDVREAVEYLGEHSEGEFDVEYLEVPPWKMEEILEAIEEARIERGDDGRCSHEHTL